MKRSWYLFLFVGLNFACSSRPTITDPNKIGYHTFELLQQLGEMTREEFIEQYATADELTAFMTTIHPLGEGISDMQEMVIRNNWEKAIAHEYDRLIAYGKDLKIDWSAITFNKYDYQIEEPESNIVTGNAALSGYLKFDSNGETFRVRLGYMKMDNEYILVSLVFFFLPGEPYYDLQ